MRKGSIMSNKEQEIYNYLLKFKTFTKKEYEELCNEYGKDNISKFINDFVSKADENLNQQEIDKFLNKYAILFDEETETNNQPFNSLNNKLPEAISQYLRSMDGIKLFRDITLLF